MVPFELCDYCQKDGACARCSRCKCAYYCNVDCQKKHWKEHKNECQHIQCESKDRIQLAKDLTLYIEIYNQSSTQSCELCEAHLEKPQRLQLLCNHVFCLDCLKDHYKKYYMDFRCPTCQKEINLVEDSYMLMKKLIDKAESAHDQEQREECVYYAQYAKEEYDRLRLLWNALVKDHTMNEDERMTFMSEEETEVSLRMAELKILFLLGKYDECCELGVELLDNPVVNAALPLYIIISLPYVDAKSRMGHHQECYSILTNTYKKMELRIGELLSEDNSSGEEMVQMNARVIRECYYLGNYNQAILLGEESLTAPIGFRTESNYEYLMRCYEAKGQYDRAIATMRRAIRYKVPWNEHNLDRFKLWLEELIKKQAAKDAAIAVAVETIEKVKAHPILPSSKNGIPRAQLLFPVIPTSASIPIAAKPTLITPPTTLPAGGSSGNDRKEENNENVHSPSSPPPLTPVVTPPPLPTSHPSSSKPRRSAGASLKSKQKAHVTVVSTGHKVDNTTEPAYDDLDDEENNPPYSCFHPHSSYPFSSYSGTPNYKSLLSKIHASPGVITNSSAAPPGEVIMTKPTFHVGDGYHEPVKGKKLRVSRTKLKPVPPSTDSI